MADGSRSAASSNSRVYPSDTVALSVLAPRSRLKVMNSEFANCLVSLLPTIPTLGQVTPFRPEWLRSNLLAVEVPMLEFGKANIHNAIQ